jgi:hypothetical protein
MHFVVLSIMVGYVAQYTSELSGQLTESLLLIHRFRKRVSEQNYVEGLHLVENEDNFRYGFHRFLLHISKIYLNKETVIKVVWFRNFIHNRLVT